MKLSEFDYNLPNNLIAKHPSSPRDAAKMLVLNRKSCKISDSIFSELPNYLKKGDVLVLNESKVIPARLMGISDGRKFEVLLVKNIDKSVWETWVKPGKKAKEGSIFKFSDKLTAKYIKREKEIFYFEFNLSDTEFYEEVSKVGQMPVPPYILKEREKEGENQDSEDIQDYQTVFSQSEGSVAAPTAGLHFTENLLQRLKDNGVQIEKVTLHVSLGTFQPVNTEEVEDYQIHSEYFEISKETAERINQAKLEGRRIIAVGTTSVRVLESAALNKPQKSQLETQKLLTPMSGETSIYIYPGYDFKIVDGMITNFHLPKSSLLLLVSAFTSKECILKAYDYAINNEYKFYSYGDGMLIL